MDQISGLTPAAKKTVVFAAYGMAMLRAHALEKRLANLLFAKTGSDDINKLTLGPLTNQFIATFSPRQEIAESLRNLVTVRNALTHRISDKMLSAAKEKDWESQLFTELATISSTFKEATEILDPYVKNWLAANGYDLQAALQDFAARYPGIEPQV